MSAEKMVTLTIDGQELTVPEGTLVIRAAEQLGIYVPRFCDHPLLDPLGACRQCLVEVEGQRKPLTACTTTVTEGMAVKTQATSEIAREGQDGVLELLLINHPLDCPQCDKGGECPLQDQALEYGPGGSRFIDAKRRYVKPIPISPLVKLDRERCVLCARCTRFSAEISGDPFIELFERGALEQVAIYEDEPYRSVFSGNVVQICPVGALTSSTFRFRARPFDMTSAPGTCNRCAAGCAITAQERRGELVRVLAADDPEVNEEWICDKGRYGFAYVQHPDRVTEPMVRKDGGFVAVSWAEALARVADGFAAARDRGAGVIGGGTFASEDSYALSRFARTVLGTNDVDFRVRAAAQDEDAFLHALPGARGATYADIEAAHTVVVAGIDLQQESPIVFLRARKAARKRGTRVIEVGPRRSALGAAPGATWIACAPGEEAEAIARLEGELAGARGALVVLAGERLGRSPGALATAWNLAVALEGRIGWVPRKAGARGAVWAGLLPAALPGGADAATASRIWGTDVPASPGRDTLGMLENAHNLGALLLAGADPAADFEGGIGVRGLEGASFVVALDLFMTASARSADVVLPAAASFERAGMWTDWEGRVRANVPVKAAPGLARPDFEILAMIAEAMGVAFPSTLQALHREMRAFEREPDAPARLPESDRSVPAGDGSFPLRVTIAPRLLDEGTMMAGADALAASAAEQVVLVGPADAGSLAAGSNVRVRTRSGSIELPLGIGEGIAEGVVVLPGGPAVMPLLEPGAVTFARVEGAV